MTTLPKSIAIGLVKAQAYARGVAKDGRNKQGAGYDYATAEDIIAEARKSLIEGGRIGFAALGWSFATVEAREAKTREKGGETKALAQAIGRIKVKYLLLSLDDGESYEGETSAPIVPEWGRPDDKAEYGALTQCHAYTLRGLLNLPRGVAGEVDMNLRDDDPPPDDRRPVENDRPSSDRPAPSRAGDHAAAAQTGVEQHRGEPVRSSEPVRDPAHVAMARDFEARAATAPDLTALYEEITESALPGEMKRAPILAIVLRVFGLVDSVNDLNAWGNIAAKAKLGELYRAQLDAGYDAALARLGRMVPPIAAE